MVEIFFLSGMHFGIFEKMNKLDIYKNENSIRSKVSLFFIGGLSGVIPKVILIPITILKKRFQVLFSF